MQKMLRSIAAILMIIVSPELFALGLGNAEVHSYMGEPLDVSVQLISNSQAELNSVTADLASASAMQAIGTSRTVSMPLRFEVHADLDNPYIQITSRLPVSDPVIQVVVEARWSGGRLVREYTFFLDPPTFPSSAPAPLIINRAASTPTQTEQQVPEIYPPPDRANVVQQRVPEPAQLQSHQDRPAAQVEISAQTATPAEVDDIAPEGREPGQTATVPEVPAFDGLPQQASTPETGPSAPDSTNPDLPAGTLGPVQTGQTLWGIASTYAKSTPYSVNQAMLAILRLNPDAFGNNNINLLKRGAILRMPTGAQMGRVSVRQAMLEAMRQTAVFKAEKAGLPLASQAATYANNTIDAVESDMEDMNDATDSPADLLAQQEVETVAEERLLQLIPPSQDSDPGETGAGSALQATGAVASEDLQEVLARTEEELANAKQENAYLHERIRELEERVQDPGGEITITDGELAEIEARLKDERLSPKPEARPVVIKTATQKWYSGKEWWLGGLFLLVIGAVVWLLKRLAGSAQDESFVPPVPEGERSTVKKIRAEAENILKSLDDAGEEPELDPDSGSAEEKGNVIDLESYGEPDEETVPPEVKPEPAEEPPQKPTIAKVSDEEAVELDGDDPETMLDLARAYISMSDSDSARKILEEVIEVGNEKQVAEARGMIQEL